MEDGQKNNILKDENGRRIVIVPKIIFKGKSFGKVGYKSCAEKIIFI